MNESRCGVPEERWVDWHLNRLQADAAEAMARHLTQCADCRRICRQWAEWLAAGEAIDEEIGGHNSANEQSKASMPASGESQRRARSELNVQGRDFDDSETGGLYPSERVYRSLRLQVIKRGLRNRAKRRSLWWIGGAAAMLLLAGFALRGLLPDADITHEAAALPPLTYAQMHVPEGAAMMAQPDTKMIAAVPAWLPDAPESVGKRTVMVWMNGRTKEMFVLFEGVLPAGSRDVQAWAKIKQVQTNLGLLEFHQAQGHLYSHGRSLADVEELAFTIEPKGGSLRPTAPETARVKLAPGE